MIDLEEQAKMNVTCLAAGGSDFPRVPVGEVKAFVEFRRERLHQLPWLRRYGFTQLKEESAWTWRYWDDKVSRGRSKRR